MRTISLDQLTVLDARPAELVEIAARAGYDAVSTIMNGIPEVRGAGLLAAMGILDLFGTTASGWS